MKLIITFFIWFSFTVCFADDFEGWVTHKLDYRNKVVDVAAIYTKCIKGYLFVIVKTDGNNGITIVQTRNTNGKFIRCK